MHNNRNSTAVERLLWGATVAFVAFSYVLCNMVFALAAVCVAIILFPFPKMRACVLSKLLRFFLRGLFVRFVPFVGGYSLKTSGEENIEKGVASVYVANHSSLLDPLILLGMIPNAGVVLKRKYGKWIAVWLLVRIFDFVEIGDLSPASVAAVCEKSRRALERGRSLLVFPEGSRSPSGRVGDFKNLAFLLSKETGACVIPVCVVSDIPFLGKGCGLFPKRPTRFTVEFGKKIDPSGFRRADEICAAAHRVVSKRVMDIRTEYSCPRGNV